MIIDAMKSKSLLSTKIQKTGKATVDTDLHYGVPGQAWLQRTKNSLPKVQGLAVIHVASGSSIVQMKETPDLTYLI